VAAAWVASGPRRTTSVTRLVAANSDLIDGMAAVTHASI